MYQTLPNFELTEDLTTRWLSKLGLGLLMLIFAVGTLACHIPTDEESTAANLTSSQLGVTATTESQWLHQNWVSYETVGYSELFRNIDEHTGKSLRFNGKVIQVVDYGQNRYQLRVNITQGQFGWTDTILVDHVGVRVIEDDLIKFVGNIEGATTYTAVLLNQVTIPHVAALWLEVINDDVLLTSLAPKISTATALPPVSITVIPSEQTTPVLNTPVVTSTPVVVSPTATLVPIPPTATPVQRTLQAGTIGLGSTTDEVRALLGPADRLDSLFEEYGYVTWEYSIPGEYISDQIQFETENGRVVSWNDYSGTLPVSVALDQSSPGTSEFGIGSSYEDVFAANGIPTSVEATYGTERWQYGSENTEYFFETNTVQFDENGTVVQWSNRYQGLHVVLGELSADTGASFIDSGVSMADVLRLQGFPSEVDASNLSFTQQLTWSWNPPSNDVYSGSSVTFSVLTKRVTGWNNAGDLKLE